MNEGQRRKEEGQTEVLDNERADVREAVRDAIFAVAVRNSEFTADEVRILLRERGVLPHHPNVIAAQFSALAAAGNIKLVGFKTSTAPSRHAGIIRVWRLA